MKRQLPARFGLFAILLLYLSFCSITYSLNIARSIAVQPVMSNIIATILAAFLINFVLTFIFKLIFIRKNSMVSLHELEYTAKTLDIGIGFTFIISIVTSAGTAGFKGALAAIAICAVQSIIVNNLYYGSLNIQTKTL